MKSNFNMLNATILLIVCVLMLIIALPGLLTRFYDKKAKESIRAEGGVYPRPQICWLSTRVGITVSVWILLIIPPFLFMSRHFVTEWFNIYRANDTRDMVFGFLICIGPILFALTLWWSYITDFKTHKDDYIHLSDKEMEFQNGDKRAQVNLHKILKFEMVRKGYNIYVENNEVIFIPYKFINSLIGSKELKATENRFKFTGQWYDSEFGQYWLRARMYDPALGRLTAYDLVKGKYEEPLTLHAYLYCLNNPTTYVDLNGQYAVYITATGMASFGQSVVGQFGFAWDDDGNFEDIFIGGWGGGTPSLSGGISVGWAPFADTVDDLKGPGGAAGGSGGQGLSVGVEAFVGEKIGMGIEITISAAVLMNYIPAEMHGHATYTKVGVVSKAISDYIFEEGIFNAKTLGQGTAMLNLGAILGQ